MVDTINLGVLIVIALGHWNSFRRPWGEILLVGRNTIFQERLRRTWLDSGSHSSSACSSLRIKTSNHWESHGVADFVLDTSPMFCNCIGHPSLLPAKYHHRGKYEAQRSLPECLNMILRPQFQKKKVGFYGPSGVTILLMSV